MSGMQQYGPGTAEFALSLLITRGTLCPHNPKLRTTAQSVRPSCLGFFHRDRKVVLLLRTSCICQSCYDKAVPNGYHVYNKPIEQFVNEDELTTSGGSEWWQFRPIGFELYGLCETVRLPLQASSKEHGALGLFSGQARPFYMPLFHTLGKVIPKRVMDMDQAITTAHGLPLQIGDPKAATRPNLPGTKITTASNRGERDGGLQTDQDRPILPVKMASTRDRPPTFQPSRDGNMAIPQSQVQHDKDEGLQSRHSRAQQTSQYEEANNQRPPSIRALHHPQDVTQFRRSIPAVNTKIQAERSSQPCSATISSPTKPPPRQSRDLNGAPILQGNPRSISRTPKGYTPDLLEVNTPRGIPHKAGTPAVERTPMPQLRHSISITESGPEFHLRSDKSLPPRRRVDAASRSNQSDYAAMQRELFEARSKARRLRPTDVDSSPLPDAIHLIPPRPSNGSGSRAANPGAGSQANSRAPSNPRAASAGVAEPPLSRSVQTPGLPPATKTRTTPVPDPGLAELPADIPLPKKTALPDKRAPTREPTISQRTTERPSQENPPLRRKTMNGEKTTDDARPARNTALPGNIPPVSQSPTQPRSNGVPPRESPKSREGATEGIRPTSSRPNPNRPDPKRPDPSRPNPNRPDPSRPNPNRPDPSRPSPTRPNSTRPNSTGPNSTRPTTTQSQDPNMGPRATPARSNPTGGLVQQQEPALGQPTARNLGGAPNGFAGKGLQPTRERPQSGPIPNSRGTCGQTGGGRAPGPNIRPPLNPISSDRGTRGVRGAPGARGPSGVRGTPGARGPSGVRGTPGASGPSSVRGTPGASGPSGVRGTPGARGPSGVRGASGVRGMPGARGMSGVGGMPSVGGMTGMMGMPGNRGMAGFGNNGIHSRRMNPLASGAGRPQGFHSGIYPQPHRPHSHGSHQGGHTNHGGHGGYGVHGGHSGHGGHVGHGDHGGHSGHGGHGGHGGYGGHGGHGRERTRSKSPDEGGHGGGRARSKSLEKSGPGEKSPKEDSHGDGGPTEKGNLSDTPPKEDDPNHAESTQGVGEREDHPPQENPKDNSQTHDPTAQDAPGQEHQRGEQDHNGNHDQTRASSPQNLDDSPRADGDHGKSDLGEVAAIGAGVGAAGVGAAIGLEELHSTADSDDEDVNEHTTHMGDDGESISGTHSDNGDSDDRMESTTHEGGDGGNISGVHSDNGGDEDGDEHTTMEGDTGGNISGAHSGNGDDDGDREVDSGGGVKDESDLHDDSLEDPSGEFKDGDFDVDNQVDGDETNSQLGSEQLDDYDIGTLPDDERDDSYTVDPEEPDDLLDNEELRESSAAGDDRVSDGKLDDPLDDGLANDEYPDDGYGIDGNDEAGLDGPLDTFSDTAEDDTQELDDNNFYEQDPTTDFGDSQLSDTADDPDGIHDNGQFSDRDTAQDDYDINQECDGGAMNDYDIPEDDYQNDYDLAQDDYQDDFDENAIDDYGDDPAENFEDNPAEEDDQYVDEQPEDYNDYEVDNYDDDEPETFEDDQPDGYEDDQPDGYDDDQPETFEDDQSDGYDDAQEEDSHEPEVEDYDEPEEIIEDDPVEEAEETEDCDNGEPDVDEDVDDGYGDEDNNDNQVESDNNDQADDYEDDQVDDIDVDQADDYDDDQGFDDDGQADDDDGGEVDDYDGGDDTNDYDDGGEADYDDGAGMDNDGGGGHDDGGGYDNGGGDDDGGGYDDSRGGNADYDGGEY